VHGIILFFCIIHGGGKRCQVQGCGKLAKAGSNNCAMHGVGKDVVI
jgi:hypothetical protein